MRRHKVDINDQAHRRKWSVVALPPGGAPYYPPFLSKHEQIDRMQYVIKCHTNSLVMENGVCRYYHNPMDVETRSWAMDCKPCHFARM